MPRKTSKDRLYKMKSGISPKVDMLARDLLMKISDGHLIVNRQEDYDDDEFSFAEYYGECNNIGVTCRQRKKLRGINPHYYMIIEMDELEEPIVISGPIGAKAWSLANVQNRNPNKIIDDSALDSLLDKLGISQPMKEKENEET